MSGSLENTAPVFPETALSVDREWSRTLAEVLLLACGGRKILHVGCDIGEVVMALLRLGVDARGVDLRGEMLQALEVRMPGRFHAAESYRSLPVTDRACDVVLVTLSLAGCDVADLDELFVELRRIAAMAVFVAFDVSGTTLARESIEMRAFATGFRKHPAYYQVNAYEALQQDDHRLTILLEPMGPEVLGRYPLAALREERDLHMDMLRESGARSDAHVARYQWALSCVRPGDRVLDAACGLGYGSYLLQTCSPAASTLGIDGSAYAVDYGNACFAATVPGLTYQQGFLPNSLEEIEDGSIDLVVSFETLEHVEHSEDLLAAFHRVLSPGGRLIVSVPNDWSDETGKDPNPFHLHVYTLDTLRSQVGRHFLMERLVAQSASRHKSGPGRRNWVPASRRLLDVTVDVPQDDAPDAEWWLAVAMRSPLDTDGAVYRESIFPVHYGRQWNVTAFARDYRNPWLVRGMVHVHHRLQERGALSAMSDEVGRASEPGSADQGAALCVQAYLQLASDTLSHDDVSHLEARVAAYLDAPPKTAQGARWRISLLFAMGRLWMAVGDFVRARSAFESCVELDPLAYSPLLGNRSVEARLLLGILFHVGGDRESAQAHWRKGIAEARRILSADWAEALGSLDKPADFGLPELASILEYASSCAMALVGLDEAEWRCNWWRRPLDNRLVEIARLNRGNARLMQASNWHASQCYEWEERARQLELRVGELGEIIGRLGNDNQWLAGQRDALVEKLAELKGELEQLSYDRGWVENQRNAWEVRSREADKRIKVLEADYAALCNDHDWIVDQRNAWEARSSEADKRIKVLEADYAVLCNDRDWIVDQRNAWEVCAKEYEQRVIALEAAAVYASEVRERLKKQLVAGEVWQATLKQDLVWHDEQRQAWEKKFYQVDAHVIELENSQLERSAALDWHIEQRDSWERQARNALENENKVRVELQGIQERLRQQDQRIAVLNTELELRESLLARIRSSFLIRVLNFIFRNRYY